MSHGIRSVHPAARVKRFTIIYDWLHAQSPSGAESWLLAFEKAARRAAHCPSDHSFARENSYVPEEIRQFLFKTRRGRIYRGVFTVVDDEVRILRVRGPGQPDLAPDELRPELSG